MQDTARMLKKDIKPAASDESENEQNQQQQKKKEEQEGEKSQPAHQRPENDEPIMVKRGVTGTVKWFRHKSGYGFIAVDDTGEEVFVHSSAIVTLRKVFCVLKEGDQVEFDLIRGLKGLEAIAVTGVGGKKTGGARFGDRGPPNRQPAHVNGNSGGKAQRRRTQSQGSAGGGQNENGGTSGEEGAQKGRKQNGGNRQRRQRGGGGKRQSNEKFVDAKESPEGAAH